MFYPKTEQAVLSCSYSYFAFSFLGVGRVEPVAFTPALAESTVTKSHLVLPAGSRVVIPSQEKMWS